MWLACEKQSRLRERRFLGLEASKTVRLVLLPIASFACAGWGQYETERVTALAMEQDPSRIYNGQPHPCYYLLHHKAGCLCCK